MTERVADKYYSLDRINGRIDAYVAGVTARTFGQKASVNPFEKGTEGYNEFRSGYLEAPMYHTGRSKLWLVSDADDTREEETEQEDV